MRAKYNEAFIPVTLEEAQQRLTEYRSKNGAGPHKAGVLADVIWPTHKMRAQGAGAAATRVLKKLGCHYGGDRHNWGWMLCFREQDRRK